MARTDGPPRIPPAFSPRQRLKQPAEFGRVFADAERSADRYFTVLGRPGGCLPRLGLTVSKRTAKRAVDRNRIKRLARESFRHRSASLPAWDFVVIARRGAAAADNAVLRASLDKHFDRLAWRAGSRFDG